MGDTVGTALRLPPLPNQVWENQRERYALSPASNSGHFTRHFISVWHSLCCCCLLACYKSFLSQKRLANPPEANLLNSKPQNQAIAGQCHMGGSSFLSGLDNWAGPKGLCTYVHTWVEDPLSIVILGPQVFGTFGFLHKENLMVWGRTQISTRNCVSCTLMQTG